MTQHSAAAAHQKRLRLVVSLCIAGGLLLLSGLSAYGTSDGTVDHWQKVAGSTVGADSYFGISAAALGDVDGDGVEDLAVGEHVSSKLHVLFLNADGTVKDHQTIDSPDGGDRFGNSVSSLGDLDGDGVPELAVGAPLCSDGGKWRGAVYVLFLNRNGTLKNHEKLSDPDFAPSPFDDEDLFGGSVVSLGDLDNDGTGDVAIGAYKDDNGGTDRGAVYVLFLNANGTVKNYQKISDSDFTPSPLENEDHFGFSLGLLGDLDSDGVVDLAVGTTGDDDGGTDRGAVYVLFLNANGTVKNRQKISDTKGSFSADLDDNDQFGWSVSGLGDLDGDGTVDAAIGVAKDDDGPGTDRGAIYVLFLNANGTVRSVQKISDTAGDFTAPLANFHAFGGSLASLDDFDGDGSGDIAAGAYGDAAGAMYLLFLTSTNKDPVVDNPIPDRLATVALLFYFQFTVDTFRDPDGDSLTYTAAKADGTALPAWLHFDAAQRTFSGTPDNNDVGVLSVKVAADDSKGGSTFDTFNITVTPPTRGDVDGDGSLDMIDVRLCLQIASGIFAGTPQQQTAADIDGDGDVDADDARTLSEYILGIRGSLP